MDYRKSSTALQAGDYSQIATPDGCFAYKRGEVTIALNFTGADVDLGLTGTVALSTYLDDAATPERLRPHEGLIIEA